jgi:hypothetical protein
MIRIRFRAAILLAAALVVPGIGHAGENWSREKANAWYRDLACE